MTLMIAALPHPETHLKLQEIRPVPEKRSCWRMNPSATHKECLLIKTLLKAKCIRRKLHEPAQPSNSINRLLRRNRRCEIGYYLTINSPPKVVTTNINNINTIHRPYRRHPPWFKQVCLPKFRRRPLLHGTKIGEKEPKLCSRWQTCVHQRVQTRN